MRDDKALRILLNSYWSRPGWKQEPETSPEDFDYAHAAGYMFKPVRLSHSRVIRWLEKSFQATDLRNVTNAFLASLTTRRLELRSALGSYAIARNFPRHRFQTKPEWWCCIVCGDYSTPSELTDLNVLNFERHKWGGVRHDHPDYIAFDLEQFSKLAPIKPKHEDVQIMRQILEIIERSEAEARPRDIERQLASIFPSNKAEREVLITILAYCGILQPTDQPGFYEGFVPYYERTIPPANKIDWSYPICWWRGADRINREAYEFYFPQVAR